MKKVLAMFLVCVMAFSLSAKSKKTLLFNRDQFQTSKADCTLAGYPALTVPFVYTGTLALDGKYVWDDDDAIYEKDQYTYTRMCGVDGTSALSNYYPNQLWWWSVKHADSNGEGVDGQQYLCYVADYSAKIPLFMTICQPCIDCYPCTVLGQYDGMQYAQTQDNGPYTYNRDWNVGVRDTVGLTYLVNNEAIPNAVGFNNGAFVGKITRWNLYIVLANKKEKRATIFKYSLMDREDTYFLDNQNQEVYVASWLNSVFFTGSYKSVKAASTGLQTGGKAYIQAKGEDFGSLVMTGVKNNYKFKYVDAHLRPDLSWKTTGNGAATAYIKSVSKFTGLYCYSYMFGWDGNGMPGQSRDADDLFGYQVCGDISLTRNASLTKAAVTTTFTSTVQLGSGKSWEDCNVDTPADFCEEYFLTGWGDKFDNYLTTTAYKGYDFSDATGYYIDQVDVALTYLLSIKDKGGDGSIMDLANDENWYYYGYVQDDAIYPQPKSSSESSQQL